MNILNKIIEKAYAVDPAPIETGVNIPGSATTSHTYETYICAIYNYSLMVGASLAVLMLIFAGYKYLTSQGNQTPIADAKEIITGTIIGFTLLVMIRFVLTWLGGDYPCT